MGKRTFRRQLTWMFIAGISVLAGVASVTTAWHAGRQLHHHLEQQGRQLTDAFARQSVIALLTGAEENAAGATTAAMQFPGVVHVAILDNNGAVLAKRGVKPSPDEPWPPTQLPRSSQFFETSSHMYFSAPVLVSEHSTALPGLDAPATHSTHLGTVLISVSKNGLKTMQANTFQGNLLVILTASIFLLIGLLALTRRITQPLLRLTDIMSGLKPDDATPYANHRDPDEIVTISRAFDTMVETLKERDQALRRYTDELELKVHQRTHQLTEAYQRAEAANKAKSLFVANVSHELRTPLQSVIMGCDSIASTTATPHHDETVTQMKSAALHLLSLIDNIIDFSKIELDDLTLRPHPFSLRTVVDTVFNILEPLAAQKHLRWSVSVDDNVPDHVHGDETKLRQVIINIAHNAIKYTETGQIELNVSAIAVQQVPPMNIRFRISDTGVGIAPDKLATIFEPFARENTMTSAAGVGLGLVIARKIVAGMGGEIEVQSTPAVGSSFTVTVPMPVTRDATAVIGQTPTANHSIAPLTILIADDDPVNRRAMTELLKHDGHRVTAVADGDSALHALLNTATVDLAILDYNMPVYSGLDVAKACRAANLPHPPTIVIITADATLEHDHAAKHVADAVHSKPLDKARLYNIIDDSMRNKAGSDHPLDDTPVLNTGTLTALQESNGLAFVHTLLTMFDREFNAAIGDLRDAAKHRDAQRWRHSAHKMKSSCCAVGAGKLRSAIMALEVDDESALHRLISQSHNRLAALEEVYDETKTAIENYLRAQEALLLDHE